LSDLGGASRLLAGLLPVLVERLEVLDGDAAVVLARVPALHKALVTVAERSPRQELAVELLQVLEPGVGGGARRGLGLLLLLGRRSDLLRRSLFRAGLGLRLVLLRLILAALGGRLGLGLVLVFVLLGLLL